jgi:Flp pilus assembly protein TadG
MTKPAPHPALARPGRSLRRLLAHEQGVSAVEFAVVAPLFCLVFVGMIDFGGVIIAKMGLDGATSAGANYALTRSAEVTAGDSATLAGNIASVVGSDSGATVTVVVNNGATVNRVNGVNSASGSAANAALCYCPTRSGDTITWGSAVACGDPCATGGVTSGRFILISASNSYQPVFSDYGFVSDGQVQAIAMVQVANP